MFYNVVMETVDISVGEFPPPEPEHAPAGEFAELLRVASSILADIQTQHSALVQMVEQHHDTVMAVGSSPTGATNNVPHEHIGQYAAGGGKEDTPS